MLFVRVERAQLRGFPVLGKLSRRFHLINALLCSSAPLQSLTAAASHQ